MTGSSARRTGIEVASKFGASVTGGATAGGGQFARPCRFSVGQTDALIDLSNVSCPFLIVYSPSAVIVVSPSLSIE